MASKDELMKALLEQFQRGDISADTYQQMLSSMLGMGGANGGDTSVTDAVVDGGIDQSRGKVDGGVHVYTAQASSIVCPMCGLRNEEKDTFRCQRCGRDHLCRDHLDRGARCCEECSAKDETERRRRKAEAEARAREEEERRRAEAEAEEERRRAEAAEREPEKEIEICGIQFVYIPPGEFMMGSADSDTNASDDEKPQHLVRITQGFYLGKYPVTQSQYVAIMDVDNPSKFKGDDRPVENVSWFDAQDFCAELGLQSGRKVRLPTEAEWEYACRAGSEARYSFGHSAGRLAKYAWFSDNSKKQTHPVGQKAPNAWGLHDMHGNVWEWCEDWFDSDYYGDSDSHDPPGPSSGGCRVLRGGSWGGDAAGTRCASRYNSDPSNRDYNYGFRVSVSVSPE